MDASDQPSLHRDRAIRGSVYLDAANLPVFGYRIRHRRGRPRRKLNLTREPSSLVVFRMLTARMVGHGATTEIRDRGWAGVVRQQLDRALLYLRCRLAFARTLEREREGIENHRIARLELRGSRGERQGLARACGEEVVPRQAVQDARVVRREGGRFFERVAPFGPACTGAAERYREKPLRHAFLRVLLGELASDSEALLWVRCTRDGDEPGAQVGGILGDDGTHLRECLLEQIWLPLQAGGIDLQLGLDGPRLCRVQLARLRRIAEWRKRDLDERERLCRAERLRRLT